VVAHPRVLAYETDLLRYPDIFEGCTSWRGSSTMITALAEMETVAQWWRGRRGRHMKAAVVESHSARRRIESGEQTIIGVNRFTETEDSPLTADAEGGSSSDSASSRAGRAVRRWARRARGRRQTRRHREAAADDW
jgi:(2R)-ethylmalonyl-CoA mutase